MPHLRADTMTERDRTPRKVGVYDRPASADRPALTRWLVYVFVVVALILGLLYLLFWRNAEGRSERGAAVSVPSEEGQSAGVTNSHDTLTARSPCLTACAPCG